MIYTGSPRSINMADTVYRPETPETVGKPLNSVRKHLARKVITIVVLSCCWAFTLAQGGQTPVNAAPIGRSAAYTPALEVYEDKSGSESIESIQSKKFHPSGQAVPSYGHTQSVYWFKLSKTNPDPEPRTFYLQVENQWLDLIDVFVKSQGEADFERYRGGALAPTAQNALGDRGLVLKLQFAPHETKTIFLRVQTQTALRVPILILSEEAYHSGRLETFFQFGIFYGILGFLIIYNVFAWSILKQSAYFYYILLLISICIFQLAWDDLIPRVSIFARPANLLHLFTAAFALVRIFNILFVSSFMDARRRNPIVYRLLDILLIICVALGVLYLVDFYLGNYLMIGFTPFYALTLTGILGLLWYRGESHARYLFVAHAPFPVLALIVTGVMVGIVPYDPFLAQLGKIGYVWQGVFFSLALADKFAAIQRNFRSMLETKVAERSTELVLANRDLRREIHERKRTEEELRQAKDAAESAAKAKSQFLANMSHEIRTPISGVLGMAELALNTRLTPEQHEYVDAIKISADALLKLINDILDFSKIEAGKLDLLRVDFSVRDTVAEIMSLMAVQANAKGLKLTYSVASDIPDAMIGDPGRLRQVLVNLLGNAIKFTENGRISLHVEAEYKDSQEVRLHFCVADTGIGISVDKRETIFEQFEQADGSTSRKYGGTGLGLAISRQLVRRMGGRIWVESEIGKGSEVNFTIPLEPALEPLSVSAPREASDLKGSDITKPSIRKSKRNLRILLAEDNPVNQMLAVRMLEKMGQTVTVASNGREAVDFWEKESFDLIFMDVQMPEMDGLEATRAIREREREQGGHIPILAMTAHALKGDKERCLAAGMDGYTSKPINSAELFNIIEHIGDKV